MRARDFFWLGSGIAVGFVIGAAFPRLRREYGPIIVEATTRASEMASQLATVVAEQIAGGQEQSAEPVVSSPPEHTAP